MNSCFITCPIHGDFIQTPHSHLKGQGCPLCGIESRKRKRTYKFEDFLILARKVHGEKYEYLEDTYIAYNKPMFAVCPKHGKFKIVPTHHINSKNGCPKCFEEKRMKMNTRHQDEFLDLAKDVHKDDDYDYSHVVYVNNLTPVEIVCPKHGSFFQTPKVHLLGCGCPQCAAIMKSKGEKNLVEFVKSIYDGEILENDRKLIRPKELDIVLPDKKLAIEYDGVYYHSSYFKKKNDFSLLTKSLIAKEKLGFRLIHVFDDEWFAENEEIKRKLKDIILGNEEIPHIEQDKDGNSVCWVDMRYQYGEKWLMNNGFHLAEVQIPRYYRVISDKRHFPYEREGAYITDCGWRLCELLRPKGRSFFPASQVVCYLTSTRLALRFLEE